MDEADKVRWGIDRMSVLRSVARQNDELGVPARLSIGEMIEEGDKCIALGLMEWRKQGSQQGRFLTDAGQSYLAESCRQAAVPAGERDDGR